MTINQTAPTPTMPMAMPPMLHSCRIVTAAVAVLLLLLLGGLAPGSVVCWRRCCFRECCAKVAAGWHAAAVVKQKPVGDRGFVLLPGADGVDQVLPVKP
jgi:hypothetical protein